MKKLLIPAALTALSILSFHSCNYEIPESISVRTKADYNFSMGSFKQDFSEFVTSSHLSQKFNSDEYETVKYKLYDYYGDIATDSSKQFMAQVKLQEIPVDAASYLSSMDISTDLASQSFNQDITIPSLAVNCENIDIDLPDFNQIFRSNTTINIPDLPVPQGINSSITPFNVNINFSDPEFKTLKFSQGNLIINLSCPTAPDSFALNTTLSLLDSSDHVISTSSATIIKKSGTVTIPLAGKTLQPGLKLRVSGKTTGGNPGLFVTYKISSGLDETTKIASVTGLKMDLGAQGKISINQDILIETDEAFVSCSIGTGSLSSTAALPSTWKGITATPDISIGGTLTKGDGTAITDADFQKTEEIPPYILKRSLNMEDYIYSKGDIQIAGNIQLALDSVNGADLYFDGDSGKKITVATECSISTVKEVTIDTEKLGSMKDKLSFASSTKFPGTMLLYVKEIVLSEANIVINYMNTLPAGNDITVSAASELLFGSSTPKSTVIESNSPEYKTTKLGTSDENTLDISTNPTIDYQFDLKLPGATVEHPAYAVFRNVNIGETYTLGVEVKPSFDWKQVTLRTDSASSDLSKQIVSDFNLHQMFDNLSKSFGDEEFYKKIELTRLPLYLYCSKPDLPVLDKINFTGKIKFLCGDKDFPDDPSKCSKQYVLGSDTTDETLSFCNPGTLEFNEKGYVISPVEKFNYSFKSDIAGLLNSSKAFDESKFLLDYSLKLTDDGAENTFTITKDDWIALKNTDKTSITVFARIIIPVELKLLEDVEIDINKLSEISTTEDIFKRTEPPDFDKYKKFIDAISKISIAYKTNDNAFVYKDKSQSAKFKFMTQIPELEHPDYDLLLARGKIDVYTNDIFKIITQYPFAPLMKVTFEKGTVYMPKEADLEIGCTVNILTDGTVNLF